MLFKWFADNLMKSNADKCHLFVSTNANVIVKIGNSDINITRCEKN